MPLDERATPPRTVFKVTVYAGMEHIYSSRNIRKACLRDMDFVWLRNGAETLSHREIARFQSQRLSQCAEELFYQMVKKRGD